MEEERRVHDATAPPPSAATHFAYLVSPAHRIVGDLEEEAVNSYTEFLCDLENANVENVPAPAIVIDYWWLPPESSSKESSKRQCSSACGIDILMDSRIFRKFFIQILKLRIFRKFFRSDFSFPSI
ncbi:ubiquinol oxidase (non-electrogenic) [Sarracenia purpurea var. burkii]